MVVKSAVGNMMASGTLEESQKKWDEDMASVEGNAKVMADPLEAIRKWNQKPWHDFLEEDISGFYIGVEE